MTYEAENHYRHRAANAAPSRQRAVAAAPAAAGAAAAEEKTEFDVVLKSAGDNKIKVVKATKLIEKYPDGIDLASILVIKNGSQVQIIIDGYDTNYRDLNAKHLLLWELIKRYANEGYTTFNLGGVSNILLSDNKYAGLNDFKMNFGAYSVEYMGDLEVITNPTLYLLHNNPIKKLIKKKNIV